MQHNHDKSSLKTSDLTNKSPGNDFREAATAHCLADRRLK